VDRRNFLTKGAAGAAILAVGFNWDARGRNASLRPQSTTLRPNAWLRIDSDDRITVLAEKPEVGQGSRTYIAMMVAEELEVDWSMIRVEQAPTIPSIYKGLHTGGSGGVQASYSPMRTAGAQAREMLRKAAAQRWGVGIEECRADSGFILHCPSDRRLRYGELVEAASRVKMLGDPVLKSPENFRFIGRSMPRLDLPGKVDGSALFGIDVRIPGMLFAVMARCPYFGGKLAGYNADAAKNVPGIRTIFPVVPLPRRFNTAGGVAVVAESSWSAIQARKLLKIHWEKGPGGDETTASLRSAMQRQLHAPAMFVAAQRGDPVAILSEAETIFEAEYESPFQAHATMEPMNTTVHVREREIEVWSPTQFADEVLTEIVELSGFPRDRVIVHMTLSGGSFGRRYQWDYAAEAWQIAREIGDPVQLLWTREDDMQHDFYRPFNIQRLTAAISEHEQVTAWLTRIVSTPIAATNLYTGFTDSPEALRDPETIAALEWYGADVKPYSIPNFLLDYAPAQSVVPRSWWRSVSSSYTAFAKECFVDELAHFLGRDPLDFRLSLLSDSSATTERLRAVLKLATEKAGWGTPLPKGRGLGLSCRVGDSCSAQVAEVSVDARGSVRVLRVVSAVDCGIAVSPDGVCAMTEGAINFALSTVLTAQITIKDGAVAQANFHDYRVLRLNEAPEIEVHIVPSTAAPSGVGELGAMLLPPAVVNAVYAATGVRVRRLPIDPKLLAQKETMT
jgi:isoquinoline 1-oxidoreductase beta subunit